MGERLSTQLETLQRERDRLEELLMLDANWRALRQLDLRESAGDLQDATDGNDLRARLTMAMAGNRIFVARSKLIETIELLSTYSSCGEEPSVRPSGVITGATPLASRIVMLGRLGTGSSRARARIEQTEEFLSRDVSFEPVFDDGSSSATPSDARVLPDALELIDGLGRNAVEVLLSHEVRSFSDIASWSPADAAVWRARLDGLAEGLPSSWIEQAAVLAAGRETYFAARVRRGEFTCLIPPPAPEAWTAAPVAPVPEPSPLESRPEAPPRSSEPPSPVPMIAVGADSDGDARLPLSSRLSLRRRGFSRPVEPAQADVEPSEVVVVSRSAESEPIVAQPSPSPTTQPNRLVRRLKQLEAEDRFSASGYAAYRGEVEEASVTIVAPDPQRAPGQSAVVPAEPGAGRGEARSVNRFLRALTGRS